MFASTKVSIPWVAGDECILWTGRVNRQRYGVNGKLRIEGPAKSELVCRNILSWKLGRPLLKTEVTRHTCDTPGCIRPEHLVAGSVKDNIHDMMQRGRRSDTSGETSHGAKLTEEQVNFAPWEVSPLVSLL